MRHRSNDPTRPFDATPPPAPALTVVRTGPTLNAAWLAIGSIAAVLGLFFATIQAVELIAHEEHDESVLIDDPAVAVLDVATHGGRVEIIGADVDDVRIDARVSDGLLETRFTHEVVGDQLQVRVRCRGPFSQWCRADLRIVVPRDLEVKVRSREDSVAVRSIDGRVDAESRNGTVEGESLGGPTRLRSNNGRVRATRLRSDSLVADSDNGSVRVEFADPPLSAILRSDNGSVDVALPRGDDRYAIDIDSSNGSTDSLVKADPTSERRIVATSSVA